MNNKEFSDSFKKRIYIWTIKLTRFLRGQAEKRDRVLWCIVDQLVRSGTSIGANYVEAIGSPSKKDFRKFLSYSLKSGNESKYWLAVMRDTYVFEREDLNWLIDELVQITNILGKSVSTMYKKS